MTSFLSPLVDEKVETNFYPIPKWTALPVSILAELCNESYLRPTERMQLAFNLRILASGTKEAVYQVGVNRVVVFRGTDLKDLDDLTTDVSLAIGTVGQSGRLRNSIRFTEKWTSGIPTENVWLIGHSLGGFLAYDIATKLGFSSVSFNPGSSPLMNLEKMGSKNQLDGAQSFLLDKIHSVLSLFTQSTPSGSAKNYIYIVDGDLVSLFAKTWQGIVRIVPKIAESAHSLDNFLSIKENVN